MGLCWKYGRFQTKYLSLKGRGLFTSGCLLSCDNQILITMIETRDWIGCPVACEVQSLLPTANLFLWQKKINWAWRMQEEVETWASWVEGMWCQTLRAWGRRGEVQAAKGKLVCFSTLQWAWLVATSMAEENIDHLHVWHWIISTFK